MILSDEPFVQVKGFCICEGYAEGIVYFSSSPYTDGKNVTGDTILVIEYPASTFLRFMRKAGGVIAYRGTNKTEAAKFLSKADKPVFFGAESPLRLSNGDKIRLKVTSENIAIIQIILKSN